MTPEITELIKKKAEKKYPFTLEDRESWYIPQQSGYTTGQIEAIEMMIGFYDILTGDFDEYPNGSWECISEERCEKWGLNFETFYSTIELLTKYIKEVLKQPN